MRLSGEGDGAVHGPVDRQDVGAPLPDGEGARHVRQGDHVILAGPVVGALDRELEADGEDLGGVGALRHVGAVDVDLEVVGHLPFDAVPFVELLSP